MGTTRVVLCDLDDTLFDHTGASRRALSVMQQRDAARRVWSLEEFAGRYGAILERVHVEVLAGHLTADEARQIRFSELLVAAGVESTDLKAAEAAQHYRVAYEQSWGGVPGAAAFVKAVSRAGVPIGIVTNNLEQEQRAKLRRLGIEPSIATLVTTDQVGVSKPAVWDLSDLA